MELIRAAEERVNYEVVRARRYGVPLSIVVVRAGNEGAPEPQLEEELANQSRGADIVMPYDEYCVLVLLTHTGLDGALQFANRIADSLSGLSVRAGLASVVFGADGGADLMGEALEALELCTDENRVVTYGEMPM